MPMGKEFQSSRPSSGSIGGTSGQRAYDVSGFKPASFRPSDAAEKQRWEDIQSSRSSDQQSAYQDLLAAYNKYAGREDDQSKILRAYYLELLNDMADARKSLVIVQRWAKGGIFGLSPQKSAISSRLPREIG